MTYSRPGRTTIGPECLTAVFGMGTGVATRVWSPAVRVGASSDAPVYGGFFGQFGGHGLRLVQSDRSGGADRAAKRSAVSTGWLSVLLHLHARPIDQVVYLEPSLTRDT